MYSKECGMYLLEIGLARPDLSFPIETADLDGDGYIDKKEFYQVFMGKLLPLSREKAIASLVALQGSEQPSPTAALTAGSLLSGSALNLLAKVYVISCPSRPYIPFLPPYPLTLSSCAALPSLLPSHLFASVLSLLAFQGTRWDARPARRFPHRARRVTSRAICDRATHRIWRGARGHRRVPQVLARGPRRLGRADRPFARHPRARGVVS